MMETWATDFGNPVEVCHNFVKESDCFLGIFSFRRGWMPTEDHLLLDPKLKKSITEAEFDWAEKYKKNIAVLLPNPKSKFGRALRKRAKDQSEEATKAQEAFRKRVESLGTRQIFDDLAHLEGLVADLIASWDHELFSQSKPAPPSQIKEKPNENERVSLNRKIQVKQFNDCLELIVARKLPDIAAFLIHGDPGCGYREMSHRLRLELQSEPRHVLVSLNPPYRPNNLAALLGLIGNGIEPKWIPNSPAEVASRLNEILEIEDVVIQIQSLQRFDGSLASFVDLFWKPLIAGFSHKPQNRLVFLLQFEQKVAPEFTSLLYDPNDENSVFTTMKLIRLQELNAFSSADIETWLRRWMKVNQAEVLAQTLIEETNGVPQSVYSKLADDDSWLI